MYAYIPLWIMLFQNGLCVFFILLIHTLNILFLGMRICIFTNAMLFQNGLCVFFILLIHTLNILFLGMRICIFTNAYAIFMSCDFCVHFSQLSHEYYNPCLQYILLLYVQRDQYLVCLFIQLIFLLLYAPIIILEIISNISESDRRNNKQFLSAQIISFVAFSHE